MIVKLVRVMLLVPFLLILGKWWLKDHSASQGSGEPAGKLTVPWFAFGFIAMVVINSLIALPEALHASLTLIGQVALTMAMAALGYETLPGQVLLNLRWKPWRPDCPLPHLERLRAGVI